MSLYISKHPNETWREAVIRHARPYGLDTECLEIFDEQVASGRPEDEAAFAACYEWDVCLLHPD